MEGGKTIREIDAHNSDVGSLAWSSHILASILFNW